MDVIEEQSLINRANVAGARLKAGLQALMQKYECIGDVRGRGLLLGLEIVTDKTSKQPDLDMGDRIGQEAMRLGLSMNVVRVPAMGAVFRIAPPLTVSDQEIDRALAIIFQAIEAAMAAKQLN